MAIDTRDKRGSTIGIDFPWQHIYPNPDGSLANVNDRQQVGYKYSGIASTVVVSTGVQPYRTLMGVGG